MSDEENRKGPGRPRDPRLETLKKRVGVDPKSKKHWTRRELQKILDTRQAKKDNTQKKIEKTKFVIGDPVSDLTTAEVASIDLAKTPEDPLQGLTDQQKMIVRLRLRGLTQAAIGKFLGITQARVSQEFSVIKKWQEERGQNVNQPITIGETTSVYEEVEYQAWMLFQESGEIGEKAKALTLVMSAREKQTKLLMDLGLLKKASTEVKHTLEVSPFLENWKNKEEKKEFAETIIQRQLPALAEPVLDVEYEETENIDRNDNEGNDDIDGSTNDNT
jgi:hypothetical protein